MRTIPAFPARQRALVLVAAMAAVTAAAQPYLFTTIAGGYPSVGGDTDGAGGDARFRTPAYTAVDMAGNVYVSDYWNATVRKITPAGVVSTIAGQPGQFNAAVNGGPAISRFRGSPAGIAVDANGSVFVADTGDFTIRRISPDGVLTTYSGQSNNWGTNTDGAATTAQFLSPRALAIDATGVVYVGDGETYVRKIALDGRVTTLAGSVQIFSQRSQTDGTGASATFQEIRGMTVDGKGNIYVIDAGKTLRKITPAGVVTTLVGDANGNGVVDGVGRAARLDDAYSITTDREGWMYVAEDRPCDVRKISPLGVVTTVLRNPATPEGKHPLEKPRGVCVSAAGDLYVGDVGNDSICKITPAGVASTLAGRPSNRGFHDGPAATAMFTWPIGIVGDSRGNLFICDSGNGLVRRLGPDGDVTTFAGSIQSPKKAEDGTGAAAAFISPDGLCADPFDNLFVTDRSAVNLRKITPAAVVTTFAGSKTGESGIVDGSATSGRFYMPVGVTRDRGGNLFVCEMAKQVVRKITPNGTVTTIAGSPGVAGFVDGPGAEARFIWPVGIAADRNGNLFVADQHAIRKITFGSGGGAVVTTFAGSATRRPGVDGTGSAAGFAYPVEVACDKNDNLFVAEDRLIRKITPDGQVTTIGGSTRLTTFDGVGGDAFFLAPYHIWVSPDGTIYIADTSGNRIVRGEINTAPTIVAQPQSTEVLLGAATTLTVDATGRLMNYQWMLNGNAITGATNSTYSIANTTPAAEGTYTVRLTNALGTTTSMAAAVRVTVPSRMTNFSVLANIASSAESLSLGAVIGGAGTSGAKPVLVRAVGPSLANVGVDGAVAAASLESFKGGAKTGENFAWGGDPRLAQAMAQAGAFALNDPTSKDAAMLVPDAAGSDRSFRISTATPGFVLAELYDLTPLDSLTDVTPRLTNLSVLKDVQGGFTAGISIGGTTSATVLIRAIGPTLAGLGITAALPNPKLELFDSSSTVIASGSSWGGSELLANAFQRVGAFGLARDSQDAALLVTLSPGNYTVRVTSPTNASGVALAEIYEVK